MDTDEYRNQTMNSAMPPTPVSSDDSPELPSARTNDSQQTSASLHHGQDVEIGLNAVFSPDYLQARKRFRVAAEALGLSIFAYPIQQQAPSGEELTIDVAIWEGNPDSCLVESSTRPDQVLVVTSGIHGVEGFYGSAVQIQLMHDWLADPSKKPTQRCVLIHALNPYGFAWRRRANEDNIDLNRNLLVDGEAYKGSPALYGVLYPHLNPKGTPSLLDFPELKSRLALRRYGFAALEYAITAGQYDYPQGIYYGGHALSTLGHILQSHFTTWLGGRHEVIHIDFHTGLGDWGNYKILFDHALTPYQSQWMSQTFAADQVVEVPQNNEYSWSGWKGGLGKFCHRLLDTQQDPAHPYQYACAVAEFGSYEGIQVLKGLCAENQTHWWGDSQSNETEKSKARLVEVFCPASPAWRETTLQQGCQLIVQALAGLTRQSLTPDASVAQAT